MSFSSIIGCSFFGVRGAGKSSIYCIILQP